MKQYTSNEILQAEDLYQLQDDFSCCAIPFQYQMTPGEIVWFKMVQGRYCIADWIDQNSDGDFLLTFEDPMELGQVLFDDQTFPKAVMLSNDTALQKLFFWLANDPNE